MPQHSHPGPCLTAQRPAETYLSRSTGHYVDGMAGCALLRLPQEDRTGTLQGGNRVASQLPSAETQSPNSSHAGVEVCDERCLPAISPRSEEQAVRLWRGRSMQRSPLPRVQFGLTELASGADVPIVLPSIIGRLLVLDHSLISLRLSLSLTRFLGLVLDVLQDCVAYLLMGVDIPWNHFSPICLVQRQQRPLTILVLCPRQLLRFASIIVLPQLPKWES